MIHATPDCERSASDAHLRFAAARTSDAGESPLQDCPQDDRKITILLATYNGAKHLDEQLNSLFAQTYQHFVIIARDDRSTDQTPAILARWATLYPNQIIVVSDEHGNLGARDNFSLLMGLSQSPYFAFCGQDDIWMPQKLELQITALQQAENRYGSDAPILVHSDVKVVDAGLREISPSYMQYRSINPGLETKLDHLLLQNVVVGCSLMGNKALLQLSRPVPRGFSYEDWWVTLVAASCGIIQTVAQPTVLYRQHSTNQVGAGSPRGSNTLWSTLWEARHLLQRPAVLRTRLARTWRLVHAYAALLLIAVGDKMLDHNRNVLQAVCWPLLRDEMTAMPWPKRAWLFARFLEIHVRLFPLALRWCY